MKTKIKTLLAICALGFIGLININAISDNKKIISAEAVTTKEEMLTNESWMSEKNIFYSAEAYTSRDFNNETDRFESTQDISENNAFTDDAYIYSAREFAACEIENEIENQTGKQMLSEIDENDLNSAESFTASGSDQEIEKYAQKQVSLQQIRNKK